MRDLLQCKQRHCSSAMSPSLSVPTLQHYCQDAEQQMPYMQDLSDFLPANQDWEGPSSSMIILLSTREQII